MNDELRRLINNLTQDIIEVYQISIPINDIDDVVERLGGHIEERAYIDNLSDGSIGWRENEFIIYVSPYQSSERRKFTIAHELGHLFLHMGYIINPDMWARQKNVVYYRSGDSLVEYQANEFAAALLMPQKQYGEVMDRYTVGNRVDTAKIADYFGVSVSAASNRGKFLGYLKW